MYAKNRYVIAMISVFVFSAAMMVFLWYFNRVIQESIGVAIGQEFRGSLHIIENITAPFTTRFNYVVFLMMGLLTLYTFGISYTLFRENVTLKKQYEFLGMVSHQLGTPLFTIKAVLDRAVKAIDYEKMRKAVLKKLNHLIALVNNLLFYLEVDKKYRVKNPEKFSLYKVFEENISKLQEDLVDKNVTVELQKPLFDDIVKGDKKAIGQVIYYFLDNAVVYNKQGGSIKVDISKLRKYLHISVEDSGIGIPVGEQKKIFKEFFRASNSSLGKNEGSGVSLHLAKMIIKKHGGKIGFEGRKNTGTKFYVDIPAS